MRHVLADDVQFDRRSSPISYTVTMCGVIAEPPHGLGLAASPGRGSSASRPVGLDQRQCHVAIEPLVVGEEDALAPACAENALDLEAPAAESGRRALGHGVGVLRRDETPSAHLAELLTAAVRRPTPRTGRQVGKARAALPAEPCARTARMTAGRAIHGMRHWYLCHLTACGQSSQPRSPRVSQPKSSHRSENSRSSPPPPVQTGLGVDPADAISGRNHAQRESR